MLYEYEKLKDELEEIMESSELQKANENHIKVFGVWLQEKNLSEKTIYNHIANVQFYINSFLCETFEKDITQGCYMIDSFLGDWFIRKAMWSSCSHIKGNAASLKKFYMCMLENNLIEKKDYDELCGTIKDNMSTWLDDMISYEDKIDSAFIDM